MSMPDCPKHSERRATVRTRGHAEPCGAYLPGMVPGESAVGEAASSTSVLFMEPRAEDEATLNDSYAPSRSTKRAASNRDSLP